MAQDLKNLFEKDSKTQNARMSVGHEARFLNKLEEALPKAQKSSRLSFLNIAASIVVLLGLSYGALQLFKQSKVTDSDGSEVVNNLKTIGDFSPDLKKVEDYYLASINLELANLELTPANKDLVNGYMERLKELNDEYDNLTVELNDNGLNEETLDALVNNLKLRLNLVMRLKDKLKEFNEAAFTQESM